MDYKAFQEISIDYMSGNISDEDKRTLEQFLIDHPEHQEEFEAMQLLWKGTEDEIPELSTSMDVKFYAMLQAETNKLEQPSFWERIQGVFAGSFPKQLAYTLAMLAIGFFIGGRVLTTENNTKQIVADAKAETENVRSQLVLALLEQPSANKRLQAVSEVSKMNKVTETILKALFTTLNNDPSVNVRLSAVESLSNYTHHPIVREGLIGSIAKQKSPLVQIALADLMVVLQEKGAVNSMKKLIDKEETNESAKQKMKQSIERII